FDERSGAGHEWRTRRATPATMGSSYPVPLAVRPRLEQSAKKASCRRCVVALSRRKPRSKILAFPTIGRRLAGYIFAARSFAAQHHFGVLHAVLSHQII